MEAEAPMKLGMIVPVSLAFSSVTIDPEHATEPVSIQAFRTGKWDHMLYGKVEMTPLVFHDMIQNFKANAFGQDLSINYEHGLDRAKGLQSAGWVKSMQIADGKAMMWSVQFTKDALQEIKDGKWRYFSPEFYKEYVDPETQQKYHNIAAGGALTNVPYFKNMMPLNFSDFFTERDLKVFFSSNAIDGNGWESSEPGTNAPNLAAIEPDKAALEGWRRDTPPYPTDILPDGQQGFTGREESLLNREQLLAFAANIGLTVDASWTDEQLATKVAEHGKQIYTELTPLRAVADRQNQLRTFAEQYPEEYQRMQKLESDNRSQAAQTFSARYERLKTKGTEEGTLVDGKYGFSALALDKMRELYVGIVRGDATVEMFSSLLDTIGDNGILEFNQRGSVIEHDGEGGVIEQVAPVSAKDNVRAIFTGHVKKYMADNEGVDMKAAIAAVAEKQPELYNAYMSPQGFTSQGASA